jgi:ubiquinone biosynthesis protein UbiJ
MAQNPLSRLASIGEELLEKGAQNPATSKVFGTVLQMKERTDDLARRVRGLEAMERRIEQLEKRLAKLETDSKPKPKPASKS